MFLFAVIWLFDIVKYWMGYGGLLHYTKKRSPMGEGVIDSTSSPHYILVKIPQPSFLGPTA
jgi:hypothetical protein